jgi:nicotinamidase-related amidase
MLPDMSDLPMITRSPELMGRSDSALLVVDVQEKLLAAMAGARRIVWNVRRLIDGARILGLPVLASEQYPQGLGPTAAELASRLEARPAKLSFSCRELPELFAGLRQQNIEKILVCGIETHVCVQQTVLDMLADGWRVYVAVDAAASRYDLDHQVALRRMEASGAVLTTTEAALFEWCQTAGTPEFKQISRIVRETEPAHQPEA